MTAAFAANPPPLGPGLAPGNAGLTAAQSDPGVIGGGTIARPERDLLIVRYLESGEDAGAAEPRYLCVRWRDWPHPTLLALSPPNAAEGLAQAVALVLETRTGARLVDVPRAGAQRVPARMPHPRTGVEGLGWLRPVAATVTGATAPDALIESVALLTADEVIAGLSTDVERAVFRAGVALFD